MPYHVADGNYTVASWDVDGITYHQVLSRQIVAPGEVRDVIGWCDTNTKTLINRAELATLLAFTDFASVNARLLLVFTDLSEAVHTRLRWG